MTRAVLDPSADPGEDVDMADGSSVSDIAIFVASVIAMVPFGATSVSLVLNGFSASDAAADDLALSPGIGIVIPVGNPPTTFTYIKVSV
ncbi:hypothetical protein FRB95_002310 [Tulasnella sp. JGI-2019a]|nr:hypothetical protein FRB95_002310 [Tulasnella sp. JGI-2019a]